MTNPSLLEPPKKKGLFPRAIRTVKAAVYDNSQLKILVGIFRVLLLVTLFILLPWLGIRGLWSYMCPFVHKQEAPVAEVDEAVTNLRRYCSRVPAVRDLLDFRINNQADIPIVYLTDCDGGPDAFHFCLFDKMIIINRRVWDEAGFDRGAYRALLYFSEYQHTSPGGSKKDTQETQAILEAVRRCLPRHYQTQRVRSLHHGNTINHED